MSDNRIIKTKNKPKIDFVKDGLNQLWTSSIAKKEKEVNLGNALKKEIKPNQKK
tara:strand:+ start:283 stop:444 length:162 start_codon:yes stop_codon:yes gene_type:complete